MPKKEAAETEHINSRLQETPIGIIGISAVFPQSRNLKAYWDNIIREIDCITDVPPSRWNIEDYYDPDPNAADKTYSKRGGFIPDIDFDPMEFGLPPNILEVTDVHQLLSLVLAKEVLRDGGYGELSDEDRENVGVILGVGGGQKLMIPLISRLQYPVWEKVLKNVGISDTDSAVIVEKIKKAYVGWEENSFPGALGNIIAGRIANRLNLGGTNCVVDAACASSFSGIRMAVSELLEHRSDMMITGGVDTDNSPYMYLCFSKTQAFSSQEKSQPFDMNSDGMIMGEGIGMLLLKRLEDAEKDGDRIYAVIKGIGSSSDGRFKSIYAPRPKGQALALKRAYIDAGFSPSTVGLIEAHGTGTAAGDLAEVTALKDFFGQHNIEKQSIAIGSVKSQIGHIKNAAGSAGIIKSALALYHKILPASINISEPNAEFALNTSPFYLNTEVRPWIHPEEAPPRRAAISAFGFGGTNFHFVLEEYGKIPEGKYRINSVAQEIMLYAASKDELIKTCEDAISQLKEDITNAYFTQLTKPKKAKPIPAKSARVGFVAIDTTEAQEKLQTAIETLKEKADEDSWKTPSGVYYRQMGLDLKGKIVALFAGQGSPYINMGTELVCNYPPLQQINSQMDSLFVEDGLKPLSKIVYPIPVFDKNVKKEQATRLQLTENAQPAIGTFSAGLYQLINEAGFKPDYVAGHSFGELTALWAANVITLKDYLVLAKARGKAMQAPDDPDFDAGSMLAVMGDLDKIEKEITDFPKVKIANLNSKSQVVLAGAKKEVVAVQKHLKKKKFRTVLLGVSAAFHTELVGHAQKPFAEAIDSVKFRKASCKVFSNGTGQAYDADPKAIQKTLQEHILNSVLFKDEIENIYKDGGYCFVEFGPQSILSKFVDNILEGKPHISIAMNASAKKDSDVQFREAVVELKVAGLQLDDIDPYQLPNPEPSEKKTSLTLKLGGMNYVSEKTKKAFEETLNDGFRISSASNAIQSSDRDQPQQQISAVPPTPEIPPPMQQIPDTRAVREVVGAVDLGLQDFHSYQGETLRVHEQFLNTQTEYSRSFFQIMQQQIQAGANSMTPEIAKSIADFHKHQGETLRIHEQYLKQQADFSSNSYELIRHQQSLLTGMDLPAPQQSPKLAYQPHVQREPQPAAPITKEVSTPAVPVVVEPIKEPVSDELSRDSLIATLLQIISEKTGYQADMLELSMDMEADLGIDSIKRVEILNGIQEAMPQLPPVNPDDLAELRTLEQIIDNMNSVITGGADSDQVTGNQPESASVQPAATPTMGAISEETYTQTLLEVVSEKTGYQADMLELNMDMEADLGIDSIKRVEILNGIQEKLPNLPAVNPEELAELRSLGQIVEYMIGQSEADEIANAGMPPQVTNDDAPTSNSVLGQEDFIRALLEVVSEKTGYLTDMLELNMDMEADLGIDSIKRVEILNGLQEKLPHLPEVNPEELAELRTLEQIVEKMAESVAAEKKTLLN